MKALVHIRGGLLHNLETVYLATCETCHWRLEGMNNETAHRVAKLHALGLCHTVDLRRIKITRYIGNNDTPGPGIGVQNLERASPTP